MVYLFIVDNHPDSGQKCNSSDNLGFTRLDLCKYACETLEKSLRQQHQQVFEKSQQPSASRDMMRQPMEFSFMLCNSSGQRSCLLSNNGESMVVFSHALKHMAPHPETGEAPYDPSFALSHAFNIINKQRLADKTDTLGCGRNAAALQPVVCFFVTDGKYTETGRRLLLQKGTHMTGADFYAEPFRWDQRIFPVILDRDISQLRHSPPEDLAQLARSTGGQVLQCAGLKDISNQLKTLAANLVHQCVVMRLTSRTFQHSCGSEDDLSIPIKLSPIGTPRYPFPESFYVESAMDTVPPRSAHPLMSLCGATRAAGDMSPGQIMAACKTLSVHMDTYEVSRASDKSLSASLQRLGLKNNELRMVYVPGSHRPSDAISDGATYPCALIGPGRTSAGALCTKLFMLPFSFVRLFPILQEAAGAQTGAELAPGTVQRLRNALSNYLWSLPGYCYPTFAKLCAQFNLKGLVQVPQVNMYSRSVGRRLDRLQAMAATDGTQMERARREVCPNLPLDPLSLIKHQHSVAQQKDWIRQDVQFALEWPPSVYRVDETELLATWESMRRVVFGGSGRSIFGVGTKRTVGTVGSALNGDARSVRANMASDWFCRGVGATSMPCWSALEMSSYMERLCRVEAPREPSLEHIPPPDEDEPLGLFRRKVAVDFGNPYRQRHHRGTSSGSVSSYDERMAMMGGSFEDVQKEADALFADTPLHRQGAEDEDDGGKSEFSVSTPQSSPLMVKGKPEGQPEEASTITSVPRITGATVMRARKRASSVGSTDSATSLTSFSSSPSSRGEGTPTKVARAASPTGTPSSSPPASPAPAPSPVTAAVATPTTSSADPVVVHRDPKMPPKHPLPAAWVTTYSKSKKRWYWFNTQNGKSSWTPPT